MLISGNTGKALGKSALFLLALTMIAGCASSARNSETQDSIFQECPPPCWLGIEPGVTDGVEAQEILIAHYGIENVTGDQYFLDWVSNTGYVKGGDISLSNENIVRDISIQVVEDTITIERVLEELGEPTLVYLNGGMWDPGEFSCGAASLIYWDLRTEVSLWSSNGSSGVYQGQYVYGFELSWNDLFLPTDSYKADWEGYINYCTTIHRQSTPSGSCQTSFLPSSQR
jgi:hypothetical protein